MNINSFFLAQIKVVGDIKTPSENIVRIGSKPLYKTVIYVKDTNFYDLNTGKKYLEFTDVCEVGDIFVDAQTLVPLKRLLMDSDVKYKENVSKLKVKKLCKSIKP